MLLKYRPLWNENLLNVSAGFDFNVVFQTTLYPNISEFTMCLNVAFAVFEMCYAQSIPEHICLKINPTEFLRFHFDLQIISLKLFWAYKIKEKK